MTSEFSFAVTEPARVEVKIPTGSVRIVAGSPGSVAVILRGSDAALASVDVTQLTDNTVRIEAERRFFGRGVDVVVTMAPDGEADVGVASADVDVDVPLRSLTVAAASGDLRVARLVEARLKTASGDVELESVDGDVEVSVASGDIRVGEVGGDAKVKSASGDISITTVRGRLEATTAAGDLTIDSYAGDDLRATAMSGDVTIGIPAGRTLDVSLRTMTGDVINDLGPPTGERTGRASLQVKTMAGDIRLRPG